MRGIDPVPDQVRTKRERVMPDYLEPTHEIWITVTDREAQIYGEALIGLVYRGDDGSAEELLAAVPRPGTPVTYRPIR